MNINPMTFKQIVNAIAEIKTIEDLNNVERVVNVSWDKEKITARDYETIIRLLNFARKANNLSDDSYLR